MGQKVSFDPWTRIIQVTQAPVDIDGEPVVELDFAVDIYSDAKEDYRTDVNFGMVPFPLLAIGGQPKPGGFVGSTFFLSKLWKIRPYESDHVLRVAGNAYREDGKSMFTRTLGPYQVNTELNLSSLVDKVSVPSEYSPDDIANIVWTNPNALQLLSDMAFIKSIEGGRWLISGTEMIFYMDDNTTEIARFQITYDNADRPIERVRT